MNTSGTTSINGGIETPRVYLITDRTRNREITDRTIKKESKKQLQPWKDPTWVFPNPTNSPKDESVEQRSPGRTYTPP